MSAAARAEARRKAILSRGTDRLAKLTSSARGEDAPACMHDDPALAPLPNRPGPETFVGEETILPSPPAPAKDARNPRSSGAPQGISPDDQLRFLQNAFAAAGQFPPPSPTSEDEPLSALMSRMAQAREVPEKSSEKIAMARPKSRLQKLMPFMHLLAAWALLAYFVTWREPEAYESRTHGSHVSEGSWKRWAELGWKSAEEGWGVQPVPFFWAFTTLTLVLHSWRIFSEVDAPQPPMLLSLALPHLPPPIPSLITNGLMYLRIAGVFLDDIAGLLVGIGLLVWIAGWLTG
ncbi:hypothetical protein AcV5_003983 [Taiwanofungus camphoratus]|nr:hypothetical protein AcV5_003983 [Antrodia cinnamomea]KAI0935603.1 hypothetical protein AcV5_003983 [Antrodia cinnamomea]KAI0960827.1 hypothetical protein AcV7_000104 [Antrodia cinnamomea]